VRFEGSHGGRPKLIDGLEIPGEYIRMLVIFGRYVLLNGLAERYGMCATEREGEDVT